MTNGSLTTKTKSTLEALVDEHFPGNITLKQTLPTSQHTTLPNIPWIADKLITQAIHSFKKDKAAGPNEFITSPHSSIKTLHYLLSLYYSGIYPPPLPLENIQKPFLTHKWSDFQDPKSL